MDEMVCIEWSVSAESRPLDGTYGSRIPPRGLVNAEFLLADTRNYWFQVLGTAIYESDLTPRHLVASDYLVAIEPEASVGCPP